MYKETDKVKQKIQYDLGSTKLLLPHEKGIVHIHKEKLWSQAAVIS